MNLRKLINYSSWLISFKNDDARNVVVSKINVKEKYWVLIRDNLIMRSCIHLISLRSEVMHYTLLLKRKLTSNFSWSMWIELWRWYSLTISFLFLMTYFTTRLESWLCVNRFPLLFERHSCGIKIQAFYIWLERTFVLSSLKFNLLSGLWWLPSLPMINANMIQVIMYVLVLWLILWFERNLTDNCRLEGASLRILLFLLFFLFLKSLFILLALWEDHIYTRGGSRCTLGDKPFWAFVDKGVGDLRGFKLFVFLITLLESLIDLVKFPVLNKVEEAGCKVPYFLRGWEFETSREFIRWFWNLPWEISADRLLFIDRTRNSKGCLIWKDLLFFNICIFVFLCRNSRGVIIIFIRWLRHPGLPYII